MFRFRMRNEEQRIDLLADDTTRKKIPCRECMMVTLILI